METSIALAIVGILASVGMSMVDFGSQDLTAVQQEFQASLHEAFHLAWAQGKDVIVTLGDPKTPGIIPVRLPPKVKWGKPPSSRPPRAWMNPNEQPRRAAPIPASPSPPGIPLRPAPGS